jgi:hypothetical protein
MDPRLAELTERLTAMGVDASAFRAMDVELELVRSPGAARSIPAKALEIARRQWSHVMGEARESRQLMLLLLKRARDGERLSDEERSTVRDQLADVFRMVPAELIAAANGALPIPGTSLLTPIILHKLRLLPSRWREAHVLSELQRQAAALRQMGRADAAERVEGFRREIEAEADARAMAAEQRWLLAFWDADGNGQLDEEELARYRAEVEMMRGLARRHASARRWFICYDGQVLGPLRLTEAQELPDRSGLLICHDGRSGWVVLADL